MSFADTEVGDSRRTAGRTITEADLVNFAGVSGDFNHLHTDAERMRESGYGERIAHGALVFSIATGLLWQERAAGGDEGSDVVAFYGVDRLRFRGPTFVSDTVHVETEVVELEERPDHPEAAGVVREEAEVVDQDGTVVLSCELLALVA
ncbi:MaoC/PaaZ C-terminal domain-containing protein [Haloarchaeobius iranensis]|uniref:Acyl dehydratase n=1 Tax=Haloarchaeobius iranensis TaxID=996166 RepID=A0A1G9T0B4_9EURY|nr:MaoC/PaaZ C-terminal domain-containing protein [Haloarchaeobius iranensis]SDM41056.1 Acyl dehydratase [Haloarchaeobius iranensis]